MEAVAALSLDYPRAIGALLACGRLAKCVQSILEAVAASAVPLQQPSWCKVCVCCGLLCCAVLWRAVACCAVQS
jgi:hypothetical protein